ncbi:MAG: hypothetical protein AB8H80_22350 [Planctomycetota bacterium]
MDGSVVEREHEHVHVRLHRGALPDEKASRFADACLLEVQSALAQIERLGQLPRRRLTLDVYYDAGAFEQARTQAGLSIAVGEFAVGSGDRACVRGIVDFSEDVRDRVGVAAATRDAMVRQLAWLCASQSSVGCRDGFLCQVFASTVLDSLRNPKFAYGRDPQFDARRADFLRPIGAAPSVSLLEWMQWDGQANTVGIWHGSWQMAGWCGQLMTNKSKTWPKKALKKRARGTAAGSDPKMRKSVIQSVLGKNWRKVEDRLSKAMRAAKPRWLALAPVVERREDSILIAGTDELAANFVRHEMPPKGAYAIEARIQLLEVGDEHWRFTFHKGERTVALSFEGDRFTVNTQSDGNAWLGRDAGRMVGPRYRPIEIRIEVRDGITLFANGAQVLQTKLADFDLHGELALSVNDSVVRVAGLKVVPLSK